MLTGKEGQGYDQKQLIKALASALLESVGEGKKAVGTTPTSVTLHGPGGIFSTFGLEREVINASLSTQGLAAELPLYPSIDTDPRYASITGVTDTYGTQPDDVCGDAPTAYLKGCNITNRFGRLRMDTNTIEYSEAIKRYNRGEFMDLQLYGSLINSDAMQAGMMPSDINEEDMLNILTMAEMVVAGVSSDRELTRQLWQGNVNVANEFPGLDSQITTGILDADIPGKTCPALDSDVKNFGYSAIDGTAKDIVEYLSMLMWYLEFVDRRTKLGPVERAIVMLPTLWYELSAVWPCSYLTNRCKSFSGTDVAVINDEVNVNLRDRMRQNMVIPVNGRDYRVVVDDGIYEHTSENNQNLVPGEFASTIYAVPLTALGGRLPLTYRQYLDYRTPTGQANTRIFNQYRRDFWTDRGVYSWAYDGQLWCYKLALRTEQRIILRAPQLAGRIDYVKYSPLQHLRSPMPDSDYFLDGGVSDRPANRTSYAVWSSAANNVVPG